MQRATLWVKFSYVKKRNAKLSPCTFIPMVIFIACTQTCLEKISWYSLGNIIFIVCHSSFYILFIFTFKVDKALLSMEEEAERIYKDERGMLLDDEAASTRDAM